MTDTLTAADAEKVQQTYTDMARRLGIPDLKKREALYLPADPRYSVFYTQRKSTGDWIMSISGPGTNFRIRVNTDGTVELGKWENDKLVYRSVPDAITFARMWKPYRGPVSRVFAIRLLGFEADFKDFLQERAKA